MVQRVIRSFPKLGAGALALSTLLSVVTSTTAMAADIQLGMPGYGGTGCPANSASVTLAPDQKSLSILFDQYVVEAGNGRTMDRKSCNIAIPVRVPQGYSISVFQIDYRGFNSLPAGARSQFNVEYFFAGSRGVRQTKSFFGPASNLYELTDHLTAEALVWTPCGADTNLRVNTSMLVQSNRRQEQAMATVDSADVTAGLVYHIAWRTCR
ncbi:MAG: DUF4360 domain-containing protein [Bdellovibrionaceae bacterium]|nr:DUF4360 domain-containing protein [Pseudobdellovibrionaceae bacterium]